MESTNERLIGLTGDSVVLVVTIVIIRVERIVVHVDDSQTLDVIGMSHSVDVPESAQADPLAEESEELPVEINMGIGVVNLVMLLIDIIRKIYESVLTPIIKPREQGDISEVVANGEIANELLDCEVE